MNAARSTLLRWIPWVLICVPLLLAAWSLYDVAETYAPTPFNDEWENVWWWRALDGGDSVLRYLVSQHNEHRLFFPRLVFLADWKLTHSRNLVNLAAIALVQLGGVAFYLQMASRRWSPLTIVAAALSMALMALLLQWENFHWGFQVQFVGVFVAAAWAIYLFVLASAEPTRLRWGVLAGAMALLTVATFSMANGFLAGVAMAIIAVLTRRGWKVTLIVGTVSAVLMGFFFRDYHIAREHTSNSLLLRDLPGYVDYVLTYLGNIWAYGRASQAACFGALGVLATVGMAVVAVRDRGRDLERTSLLALILFIELSAAVTGAGRLGLGTAQALSSRYATPTCHFWAAQALFWALTATASPRRTAKIMVAAALLTALLATVDLQRRGERELFTVREQAIIGTSALLAGNMDPAALTHVYPEMHMVQDFTPYLREHHLTVFADDPGYRVGWKLIAPVVAVGGSACNGFVDVVARSGDTGRFAKMMGWGWDTTAGRPFERVLITDPDGMVLGVGLSGLPRPDVRRALRQPFALRSGWGASVARTNTDTTLVAYGLLSDGRACELGRKLWPR